MKKLIIILILLLTACTKQETVITNVNVDEERKIRYGDKINLYDLVKIEDGKIITDNFLLDTTKLGAYEIKFNYEDNVKKKHEYKFNIKVIDDIPPVIYSKKTYYLKQGEKDTLLDEVIYGDNYDRNVKINIIGDYDINKIGEYELKFKAVDINNNETTKDFKLVVVQELSKEKTEPVPYQLSDLISNHKKENTMIGIDVSVWQGDIDYKKVKESGIEFVMIRIGYGHNSKNEHVIDSKYQENIKKAREAGLLVGIYYFSYADSVEEALDQAEWIIKTLNNEKLDLPIAFDWEVWESFNDLHLNFHDLNNIALTFLDKIKESGYETLNYGSAFYLNNVWNINEHQTWLAHYIDKTYYEKEYQMWQITNTGVVPGIKGYVDLNILYKK